MEFRPLIGAFSFCGLLLWSATLMGQWPGQCSTVVVNASGEWSPTSQSKDSVSSWNQLRSLLLSECTSEGYLVPTIVLDSQQCTVAVSAGQRYEWVRFQADSISLEAIGKRRQRRIRSFSITAQWMEQVVKYYENRGYPFCSVRLDSVQATDAEVSAVMVTTLGPRRLIDSVVVNGTAAISHRYLQRKLGLMEGSLYNESAIKAIERRLNTVAFVQQQQQATVLFKGDQTEVNLFLTAKPASRFDAILGFLPNAATGKTTFVGDASVHLENALKRGEVFNLTWRRLQTQTQDLSIDALWPYAIGSPLSPDARLKIYRRDSSFTDVAGQIGLRFSLTPLSQVRVFAERQQSRLLSTAPITSSIFLDVNSTLYGLGWNAIATNDAVLPTRGVTANLEAAAGNKVIVKNAAIAESVYDSLSLQSLQWRAQFGLAYYLPFFGRMVWHQHYAVSVLKSDNLQQNEAWRLGGFKTIRGFNEESLFATSYGYVRSELRFMLDRQSFAFLLTDALGYVNEARNPLGPWRDWPWAVGAGFNTATAAGLFSISYALGSEQGNRLQLRSSKIHFGYTALF